MDPASAVTGQAGTADAGSFRFKDWHHCYKAHLLVPPLGCKAKDGLGEETGRAVTGRQAKESMRRADWCGFNTRWSIGESSYCEVGLSTYLPKLPLRFTLLPSRQHKKMTGEYFKTYDSCSIFPINTSKD